MSAFNKAIPMIVTDRVVRLAELGVPWVHRRRFVGCAIMGPPPALLSGCYIQGSRWLGVSESSFVIVDDPTNPANLPGGTISFVECTFDKCEFINFTAVGSHEQIDALKALFPLAG